VLPRIPLASSAIRSDASRSPAAPARPRRPVRPLGLLGLVSLIVSPWTGVVLILVAGTGVA
jgi:hypothetical protein